MAAWHPVVEAHVTSALPQLEGLVQGPVDRMSWGWLTTVNSLLPAPQSRWMAMDQVGLPLASRAPSWAVRAASPRKAKGWLGRSTDGHSW